MYVAISVIVPTDDRGFCVPVLCWIATTGDKPKIESTSARSSIGNIVLEVADIDSKNLRCASPKMTSKANEVFPDPDTPVITVS